MHATRLHPTESVERPALLRFVIRPFMPAGRVPKIRACCHHNLFRREAVTCGDVMLVVRTHWPVEAQPHQPQYCTRCNPWGRRLGKALLCALDKHIIFPGNRVALCESADQALAAFAACVGDRFVCCAMCSGSPRRTAGTWNGHQITP
ncbi:MAG: hypothetical protein NUV56_02815 [Candidatus Uhrbacteria bacterium]|nr:hypothetical protein [Candidatus Uhrbacteria bacterium]